MENINSCIFTNDDFCEIKLLNHHFTEVFKTRNNHEVLFRKINIFLIKNNIIKNNIIDSGCWIGDNSIPWAKNINSIVYAIDPSIENFNFINEMCKINGIDNIKTIKFALNESNEILSTNNDIQHCSFIYGNPGKDGINKTESVSLDYLYETNEIMNIGYIHLDVEGMEFKVLKGSSNIIDKFRPVISFEQHLELEDYSVVLKFLTEKKYSVYLVNEILPGCSVDCRNSFAFPNEITSDKLIQDINNFIGFEILTQKILNND